MAELHFKAMNIKLPELRPDEGKPVTPPLVGGGNFCSTFEVAAITRKLAIKEGRDKLLAVADAINAIDVPTLSGAAESAGDEVLAILMRAVIDINAVVARLDGE